MREYVASGLYGSASEVICEALRLFEADQSQQLQVLREAIAKGLEDEQVGRLGPLDVEALKAQARY